MNAPNQKPQPTAIQRMTPQQQRTLTVRDYLEARKSQLAAVLPKHMTPERVVKVALAAITKEPKLLECTPESLYLAVRQACEIGLEPGGALGQAYIVPFKGSCTLIPGYRGLIDLARRSGEIQSIEAHVVREQDKFELRFGLDPKLEHVPCLEGDAGDLRFVYAIAKLKDGGLQFEVMTRAEIERIRDASPGIRNPGSPWHHHFDEMARKTVVRRLIKYLPLSSEKARPLAEALELDSEPAIDVTAASSEAAAKAESRTAQVFEALKQQDAQTVEGEVVSDEPPAGEGVSVPA